ncbi:polyprenyl synthetase family protein [Planctomycetota bacterium]
MGTSSKTDFLSLKEIFQPISHELSVIDDIIKSVFKNFEGQIIQQALDVLINSPGKRIRPALFVLSAHTALAQENSKKQLNQSLLEIAAAVELIHQGSLLHDDLLDEAVIRHGVKTINEVWGNKVAVFLGDYVCARAFKILTLYGDQRVLNCLGDAVKMMCEGELIQIINRGNFLMSQEHIMAIIKKKTSLLFEACCYLGAALVTENEKAKEGLSKYGINFGIAFQLIDDLRDLVDEHEKLGKHPAQDIHSGDITLPLSYLFNAINQRTKGDSLKRLTMLDPKVDTVKIRRICLSSGVLSDMRGVIESYLVETKNALAVLADSDYKTCLCQIVDYMSHMVPNVV